MRKELFTAIASSGNPPFRQFIFSFIKGCCPEPNPVQAIPSLTVFAVTQSSRAFLHPKWGERLPPFLDFRQKKLNAHANENPGNHPAD